MDQPITQGWDASAAIFLHVLFTQNARRDPLPVGVGDRRAESTLAFEDTLRMMAQAPMSEVTELLLRCIEPVMQSKVIGGAPKTLRENTGALSLELLAVIFRVSIPERDISDDLSRAQAERHSTERAIVVLPTAPLHVQVVVNKFIDCR
jgi:hypothetical protein